LRNGIGDPGHRAGHVSSPRVEVLEIQLAHEEVLVRGAAAAVVVMVLVAKVVLRVGFGGHAIEGVGVRAAGI